MDCELGRIDLIYWQSRNRRMRAGLGPWTAASLAGLLVGGALAAAEAAGWLHLSGPLAAAPAALILAAAAGRIVAAARAAFSWLGG